MRYLLTSLILLSTSINAQNLCPINDKIAEDMQIAESEFNQENAEKSLQYLSSILNDPETPFAWFSIPNALKFI